MADTPEEPSNFEETVKSLGELHGNMAVLSKLDAVLKNYDTDISEPEQLIQSDGAISGTIVQIANSPLYGFSDKSENIATALQKVGYHETLKLVSLALSKQVFMKDLTSYGVSADSYWQYSYFTAIFMERQAKALGLDPNEAYLLGLLHSIGRVVINEILHLKKVEVYWDRYIPEDAWERYTIGIANPKAGATLLRIWDFPEGLSERVEKQNEPEAIERDPLLSLLDFSRDLARNLVDRRRLASLCRKGSHPARNKIRAGDRQLFRETTEIEAYVDHVYSSLKDC